MTLSINDVVVHSGARPGGRVIRVSRIEPWPVLAGTTVVEDATSRCHGHMIVFDRLVPAPPAPIEELRLATAEEISQAERLGLLPPTTEDGPQSEGGPGDREPRGPRPDAGAGGAALLAP